MCIISSINPASDAPQMNTSLPNTIWRRVLTTSAKLLEIIYWYLINNSEYEFSSVHGSWWNDFVYIARAIKKLKNNLCIPKVLEYIIKFFSNDIIKVIPRSNYFFFLVFTIHFMRNAVTIGTLHL